MPSPSSPIPSSFSAQSIPSDNSPRILVVWINKPSGNFTLGGSFVPAFARATLSPAFIFFAPQTMLYNFLPSVTSQITSFDAFGCGLISIISATNTSSNPFPIYSRDSTSSPTMVRLSANSSGEASKSTYSLSQLRVNLILFVNQGNILKDEMSIFCVI